MHFYDIFTSLIFRRLYKQLEGTQRLQYLCQRAIKAGVFKGVEATAH